MYPQEIPPESPRNHWATKLSLHIIVINALLNMLILASPQKIILIGLTIWLGNNIQKDKLVVEGIFASILIFFAIMDIKSIYNNIQILINGIYI